MALKKMLLSVAVIMSAFSVSIPAFCDDPPPPTSGKHPLHLAVPGITCGSCHNTDAFPYFKSGTDRDGNGLYDLSETDVCTNCHKEGW